MNHNEGHFPFGSFFHLRWENYRDFPGVRNFPLFSKIIQDRGTNTGILRNLRIQYKTVRIVKLEKYSVLILLDDITPASNRLTLLKVTNQ